MRESVQPPLELRFRQSRRRRRGRALCRYRAAGLVAGLLRPWLLYRTLHRMLSWRPRHARRWCTWRRRVRRTGRHGHRRRRLRGIRKLRHRRRRSGRRGWYRHRQRFGHWLLLDWCLYRLLNWLWRGRLCDRLRRLWRSLLDRRWWRWRRPLLDCRRWRWLLGQLRRADRWRRRGRCD